MPLKTKHNELKNILITAATAKEVPDLVPGKRLKAAGTISGLLKFSENASVDLLITGPGIQAATYHLTRQLIKQRYDLVLNLGVCGSLDPAVKPVRLVRVKSELFADLGAENGNNFLDIFELGLQNPNHSPFKKGLLHESFNGKLNCLSPLLSVAGITVNKAHGATASVKRARERFGNVMESMEGAAVFYVCKMENVACLQVRAVSNMVEKRNREKWKIKEAIDALSGFTGLLLLELALINARSTS